MNRGARAFTLVEVMIALAMMGMLAGAAMSFLWSVSSRQRSLAAAVAESQAADALLDRLESDLLSVLAGDPKLGAGVQGSATRLRLLTRGVDITDGGAGDLQEAVFAFEGSRLTLLRRPVHAEGASVDAVAYPLYEELSRVRFRYFDGRSWASSFDSGALKRLPAAIEIEVWRAGRGPTGAGNSAGPAAEWPEPDRSRVIVVPDGPDAAWSSGRERGGV